MAMVVLLALTLSELRTSRTHIADQDAKVTRLLQLTRPALEEVPPLTRQAEPLLADARPLLGTLAETVPPLLASGESTLDRLPALTVSAQALVGEAIPALIGEAIPALQTLSASELGPALATVETLTLQLLENDRLAATLDQTAALLERVETLDLPARAARTAHRIRRLLRVQRRTFSVQKRTLAIQQRSLQIQTETLGHVRSIDEKTGGQAPPIVP